MKNRTPVPRAERAPLPDFDPVPRQRARHDGWTPERQKAFIEALADTGSVSRAAAMVNMTPRCAYYLRRQPGAEGFRRAWEAALDFGVARMKDIAFERAVEGALVPVLVGGKLIGWRRIYNDRLLMFCLRHYGEDAQGRRTTINYFSTRASAGVASAPSAATPTQSVAGAARRDSSPARPAAGEAEPFDVTDSLRDGAASLSTAETSVTSVRTTMREPGPAPDLDQSTDLIDCFAGLDLDDRAQAEILAVLEQCAARRRAALGTVDDESEPFVAAESIELPPDRDSLDPKERKRARNWKRPAPIHHVSASPYDLVEPSPHLLVQPDEEHRSSDSEMPWTMLDDEAGMERIEEAIASVRKAKLAPPSSSSPRRWGPSPTKESR